jgi:endonuclease YncB( thermonuclease family)
VSAAARGALSAFFKDRPWSCKVAGKDRYDRFLASCSIAGENVNQWMVRHGWVLAFVNSIAISVREGSC